MPRSPRQVRKDVQEAVTEQVRDLPINAVRLAMFGVGRALLLSDRLTKDYKEIKETGVGPVLGRWRNDAEQAAVKVIDRVVERVTGAEELVTETDTPVARPPRKVNNSLAAEPELAFGKPAPSPAGVTEIAPEPVVEPESEPVVIAVVEPALEPVLEPEAVPEPDPKPVPKPAPEPVTAKPRAKTEPAKPKAKAEPARPKAKTGPKTEPVTAGSSAKTEPVTAEPTAKAGTAATAAKPKSRARAKPAARTPKSEPVAADALPIPSYDELTLASVRARLRKLNIEQVSLLRDYERANAARADFLRMYANRITKLKEEA